MLSLRCLGATPYPASAQAGRHLQELRHICKSKTIRDGWHAICRNRCRRASLFFRSSRRERRKRRKGSEIKIAPGLLLLFALPFRALAVRRHRFGKCVASGRARAPVRFEGNGLVRTFWSRICRVAGNAYKHWVFARTQSLRAAAETRKHLEQGVACANGHLYPGQTADSCPSDQFVFAVLCLFR